MVGVELPGREVAVLGKGPVLADVIGLDEIVLGSDGTELMAGVVEHDPVCTFAAAWPEPVCGPTHM